MDAFRDLPRGAVLAECDLFHVGPVEDLSQRLRKSPEWDEVLMGDFSSGRKVWLTRYMVAFPEPVPFKGRQGLWELPTLPDGMIADGTTEGAHHG